jgi:hypothetical protein
MHVFNSRADHQCYPNMLVEAEKLSKQITNRTYTVLFDVHSKV